MQWTLLGEETVPAWVGTVATGGTVAALVALGVLVNQLLNAYTRYSQARKQAALDSLDIEEREDAVETKRRATIVAEHLIRIGQLEAQVNKLQDEHLDCEKRSAKCEERVSNMEARISDVEARYRDVEVRYRALRDKVGSQSDSTGSYTFPPKPGP